MAYGTGYLVRDVIHYPSVTDHFRHCPFPDTEKLVGAEDYKGNGFFRNVFYRFEQAESVFACNGADNVEFLRFADLAERHYPSVCYRDMPVRDDGVHVDVHYLAEALAVGTVALGRVE